MHISKITLSQWTMFDAVIREGGYLKAAAKLNRSHSSLHHAVNKLQQQLGVTLLEVHGKQPVLTATGQVVHRRAQQLLKDVADLETLARQLNQGWESEITIAVENIFPKSLLHPVLKKFNAANLNSRLKILDVVLGGAVEAIENATANLVITPILPQGYLGTQLITLELRPYAHRNHILNQQPDPVSQKELANTLQIVIKDTATNETKTPFGWLRAEKRWTVSDFYHALEILKIGDGFCWAPAHLFAREIETGEIKAIPTEGNLSRAATLYLVEPKPDARGPGVSLLADLIREEAVTAPLPSKLKS
jgi:DNA-binding transcriptional LysR family regulator